LNISHLIKSIVIILKLILDKTASFLQISALLIFKKLFLDFHELLKQKDKRFSKQDQNAKSYISVVIVFATKGFNNKRIHQRLFDKLDSFIEYSDSLPS
jgi:hypothetical protein